MSISSSAQSSDSIQKSTIKYIEKIYLHLDRYAFSTGDDIWFKAYLVNGHNNKLSNHSAVLYTELLTSDLQLLKREVIHLKNGLGNGDIHLNDSLPAGRYRIRAYTSYILNFGNSFLFEKEISIHSKIKAQPDTLKPSTASSSVRFFPEGGALVAEVENNVAFKAKLFNGQGCVAKGVIREDNKEICRFETSWQGMGSLLFTPKVGKSYYAEGITNGQTFSYLLPSVLSQGFVLNAHYSDSVISVTIKTNDATFENYVDDEFVLRIQSMGQICINKAFELSDKTLKLNILSTFMPTGIVTLTLLDKHNRPHCERLIYIENPLPKISTAVQENGDSVRLTIRSTNKANRPISAFLSLAVTDSSITGKSPVNVFSYLTLESEIRGYVQNLSAYFDNSSPERFARRDLLMLTQGWRDYVWKHIEDSIYQIRFQAEKGLSVRGQVLHRFGGKPALGNSITMYMPKAKLNKLQVSLIDSSGHFSFDEMEFYGWQKVILTSCNSKGKKSGWIIPDSAYLQSKYAPATTRFEFPTEVLDSFTYNNYPIFKEKKKYSLNDTILLQPANVKSRIEYRDFFLVDLSGIPKMEFNITPEDSEYPDLRWYLLNHHPRATFNPKGGLVFYGGVFKQGPICTVCWINGKNPDSMLLQKFNPWLLDMNKIEKVEVIHKASLNKWTFKYSDIIIVNIFPRPNAVLSPPEYYTTTEAMEGYYQARKFYDVQNSMQLSSFKRLNTPTVFWEPHVNTSLNGEATVSFKKTDHQLPLCISIEGLSTDGNPISYQLFYHQK
jgi:hypothetical protein